MIHEIQFFIIQHVLFISIFFLVFLGSIIAIEKLIVKLIEYRSNKRNIELDTIVNNLNKNLLELNRTRVITRYDKRSGSRIRSFSNYHWDSLNE